jgi:hypothetical protein
MRQCEIRNVKCVIRRMRFAFWITKATNTHSEYLMLFHDNNGYANAPLCYVMRTLPLLFVVYFATLSLRYLALHIVNDRTVRHGCIRKDLEGNVRDLIGIGALPGRTEGNGWKLSVTSVQTKIRTGNFRNVNLVRCRFTTLRGSAVDGLSPSRFHSSRLLWL